MLKKIGKKIINLLLAVLWAWEKLVFAVTSLTLWILAIGVVASFGAVSLKTFGFTILFLGTLWLTVLVPAVFLEMFLLKPLIYESQWQQFYLAALSDPALTIYHLRKRERHMFHLCRF
jgi:hypothetical protein